jgi:hypothetical protein
MSAELPPELKNVVDEYDSAHNADTLRDYSELFDVLRQIHELHPQWRFGQIVTNLMMFAGTTQPGDVYSVPDERLLQVAKEYLARRRAPAAAVP